MRTIIELVVILGLAAGIGSGYIALTGKQDFTSSAARYPDARVCKMGRSGGERSASSSGGGAVTSAPGDGASATANADSAPDDPDTPGVADAADRSDGDVEPETDAEQGIPHIGFEEAKLAWEDGLLFVDARAPTDYEKGHIPGARSIPAWEPGIDQKVAALSEEFGTAIPVIVYCNRSEECEDSHIAGAQLRAFGFTDLQVYEGGFPGWYEEKMPYVEGAEPGSVDTAVDPSAEEGGAE